MCTQEKFELVQQSIQEGPRTSTRRRSGELGILRTSSQRMQTHLCMYSYKVQLVHALKPIDYQQRLNYTIRIQEMAKKDNNFIHNLIMGDEAHFHLNGSVNKQNSRFWGTENPRVIHQHELHHPQGHDLVRCNI